MFSFSPLITDSRSALGGVDMAFECAGGRLRRMIKIPTEAQVEWGTYTLRSQVVVARTSREEGVGTPKS